MYTIKVRFKIHELVKRDNQLHLIDSLVGSWRMNGQVLGREFPIAKGDEFYSVFLQTPEENSLSSEYNNKYVNKALQEFEEKYSYPDISILGIDPESSPVCKCETPSSYILYTDYVSLEPPLRCKTCFNIIPLYTIPKTDDDEYHQIISWMSDYQSCDRLQMNCSVGERFAINQLSKLDSPLTKLGLEICESIYELTGKKTFYYLYKGSAKSYKTEIARKCPCCNGEWYQEKSIHEIFDFQCEECALLSNIAWDTYQ